MKLLCREDHPSCAHPEWEIAGAAYNKPAYGTELTGFIDAATRDALLYGFTTITQRCKACKKATVIEHRGRAAVPGYTWATT